MNFSVLIFSMLLIAFTVSNASPISNSTQVRVADFPFPCKDQPKLVCVLRPTKGNKVQGEVKFKAVYNPRDWSANRCYVHITATVRGLTPGKHGIHIHAFGDERTENGSSLGGHFLNPQFSPVNHGLPNDSVRHWGDFGNIYANKNGVAQFRTFDRLVSIKGIVGRGMVVHGGEDMGADEQPSGAAGPRQATCVIGFSNTKH